MLKVRATSQFESDFRRMVRVGNDPELLWAVVEMLANEYEIPEEFRDHELTGRWAGVRDIHIQADWLLLYEVTGDEITLVRTGTHRDLFSKS